VRTRNGPAVSDGDTCVLDERCGSHQALGLVANKWTVLVVHVLADGTRRDGDRQREIGGVSQKVLTRTLRRLERDGLVERKMHPVVPPTVEYSLTRFGESLPEPLEALCAWAERHVEELETARPRRADP